MNNEIRREIMVTLNDLRLDLIERSKVNYSLSKSFKKDGEIEKGEHWLMRSVEDDAIIRDLDDILLKMRMEMKENA